MALRAWKPAETVIGYFFETYGGSSAPDACWGEAGNLASDMEEDEGVVDEGSDKDEEDGTD
ncbi:predicted protein [Sclerotinia sclerotiorum 1980 UF-70]|uniref:Uncharacterized protein n=1 Tax=Sclerotinia sclerotiorum (strain ATCC 18683 / 1980 / Ss-1) TaxID=665079 RepID=A7F835_SCLS1|nr:predicted protein [Sclerotinia sclerotiorum 1980 UF-70]EDN98906.1 predicted protein [Sclerotinia sclerotiorum 1980 UF-70]